MLFASADFLLFFLPVLWAYWSLRGRPRASLWLLLGASYFFYVAGPQPVGGPLPPAWYYAGLLVFSTVVDYACGLGLTGAKSRAGRGFWLGLSLISNLGLLGYFKYTGFALEVAEALAGVFGGAFRAPVWQTLLPIGISFYTFQSLSYTIDVWRGRLAAERSFVRFALFVAFFPQLVAGPIVRASELLPQLGKPVKIGTEDINAGAFRILKGLFKKVVLGDFVAANFTDLVFASPAEFSSLENVVALYAFTLQIYADFSGYSDIAIGVARLLGYRLPENFDRPYQSANVGEFWRRWHMTLSSWLRDYLFFPLGGSRAGQTRTYVNLWITLFLVGMWHGASWNFLIYSNLQAFAVVVSRYVSTSRRSEGWRRWDAALLATASAAILYGLALGPLGLSRPGALFWASVGGLGGAAVALLPQAPNRAWARPVHVLLTFHFCVLCRVFFRSDGLGQASAMLSQIADMDGLGLRPGLLALPELSAALPGSEGPRGEASPLPGVLGWLSQWGLLGLIGAGLGYHFTPARWTDRLGQQLVARLPAALLAVVFCALLAALSSLLSGPRANIYFAF